MFKISTFKDAQSKTRLTAPQLNKIAIALSLGALSLTGCSAAPTAGAAAVSPATGAAPSAAASTPSAATQAAHPAAKATASAAAASKPAAPSTPKPVGGTDAAPAAPGTDVATPAASPVAAPAAPAAPAAGAQAAATPAPTAVTAPVAAQAAVAATGDGSQAATARGWGAVVAGDEFSKAGAPDSTKWGLYSGAGHAGKGVRSPQAWSVANGMATVTGNSAGTTGGMSAKFANQKYGKWETRMKTNARDTEYHPVVLLWPNTTSPNCAEIDYAEGSSSTAKIQFFLHYACGGSNFQTYATKSIDTTQWHNYAVEWTPAGITGYIDGVKTFSDTNPAHLPSVGMHQTLQLDWFPDGSATKTSQMQVDWVRVYK